MANKRDAMSVGDYLGPVDQPGCGLPAGDQYPELRSHLRTFDTASAVRLVQVLAGYQELLLQGVSTAGESNPLGSRVPEGLAREAAKGIGHLAQALLISYPDITNTGGVTFETDWGAVHHRADDLFIDTLERMIKV